MYDSLAIIVPAYKARFLQRALASLAPQITSSVRLYVFDDASPEPIESVVRSALRPDQPNWSYHRFQENLGGTAIIRHYARCIARTTEPWIWLFSDDDVADEHAVASFLTTAARWEGRYDLFCFDTLAIDADDQITALHPPLPDHEGWKQYASTYFAGHREVPQQAMIFSRAAYERIGGFVEFPVGWASDQATAIALAGRKGLRRVPNAHVRFRFSGENISSRNDRTLDALKLQAAMEFLDWVLRWIGTAPDPEFPAPDDLLRRQAFAWFRRHLRALHTWYTPAQSIRTARFLSAAGGDSYGRALARMAALNVSMLSDAMRGLLPGPAR